MFLTRMVNGLLNTNRNNSCFNQNDQPKISIPNPDPQDTLRTIPNKSKRKSDKSKRIDPKKSITKFFKSSPKESNRERQQPSTSKRVVSSNDGNSKLLLPTKVKSGSWKRTDKTNTVLNVLTNKKTKALRKKSPNLLKFSNGPLKLDDKLFATNTSESNSACRPGTLYSDVLFGAAPSSLIKVKILTPRRNVGETAQKKLTKALYKYSYNDKNDPTTDESEMEGDQNIFPSLHQLPHCRAVDGNSSVTSSSPTPCSGSPKTITSLDACSNSESLPPSGCPSTKTDPFDEADVVILSEHYEGPQSETSQVTYGNYLEQKFQELDVNCGANASNFQQSHDPSRPKSQFHIDIASWNFTKPDVNPDGFPKFLQQFDDENYLKQEKFAMLGLNLALGNSPHQGKFKF